MHKKVGIASAIMMASVFLSRMTGLVREMVIAYVAGAGGSVDAYQIAFVIPEILNHLAACGFLSVTFIPIFTGYLVQGRHDEGWHVFSNILNCFGLILALLTVTAFVFAPQLIRILAPGLDHPELIQAAVRMTRIIMPAQLFFFAGGLFMAVQFAGEKFFIPALAPLIYNLGIITGGVVLAPWVGMDGFAWGVLGGAFIGNFILQYWGASKMGMKWYPVFQMKHPDLRRYVLLTLPLMLGLTMTFSTEIFLKFFGSFLPRGGIAALNYALRIMFMLVGLFGQAVGTASFPFLARLAAEKQFERMNRLLNSSLCYLSVVIPFSVLLMVLRYEVITIIFQRGRFDVAATHLTAGALLWLLTGACGFAAQTVVVRGYYAVQNTLLPAILGTVAVVAAVPFYWYGLQIAGIAGVAMAVSVSVVIQVLLLYGIWCRISQNSMWKSVVETYGKIAGLSVCLWGILEMLKKSLYTVTDAASFAGAWIVLSGVAVAFVILLTAGGYLLRIREITELLMQLIRKIRRLKYRS